MRNFATYKQRSSTVEGLRMPDTKKIERQVLCDIINDPGLLSIARMGIDGSMFSVEEYRQTWNILNEMADRGDTIDYATLQPKITLQTLTELLQADPGGELQTRDHCAALVEMSNRRLLFMRAYEMLNLSSDPGVDYSKLIALPGEIAEELYGRVKSKATTQSVKDVLHDYTYALMDQANGLISRIPTGFQKLDGFISGGWSGGSLVVMSARPSVGKSAVMLQMALSASRAGFPSTVYSLEMPNRDLGQRLVLSTGDISPRDIESDRAVQAMDFDKLHRASTELDELPIWFNTRLRTLDEICNDIRLQCQRGRCKIAFVDHLHIISSTDSRQLAYQAITERTRRFKTLAMDCGIPIVLLCQLNRLTEAESRAPELRDLRDSGSIEQDADIVIMLRRQQDENGLPTADIDMFIRKNRNGQANVCVKIAGDVSRGFTVFNEIPGPQ